MLGLPRHTVERTKTKQGKEEKMNEDQLNWLYPESCTEELKLTVKDDHEQLETL